MQQYRKDNERDASISHKPSSDERIFNLDPHTIEKQNNQDRIVLAIYQVKAYADGGQG